MKYFLIFSLIIPLFLIPSIILILTQLAFAFQIVLPLKLMYLIITKTTLLNISLSYLEIRFFYHHHLQKKFKK